MDCLHPFRKPHFCSRPFHTSGFAVASSAFAADLPVHFLQFKPWVDPWHKLTFPSRVGNQLCIWVRHRCLSQTILRQSRTRLSKVIYEQAMSPPLMADPLIAAAHNCSVIFARWHQCAHPSKAQFLGPTPLTILNGSLTSSAVFAWLVPHSLYMLSLIHIWRCRRSTLCRSRWSPYH